MKRMNIMSQAHLLFSEEIRIKRQGVWGLLLHKLQRQHGRENQEFLYIVVGCLQHNLTQMKKFKVITFYILIVVGIIIYEKRRREF